MCLDVKRCLSTFYNEFICSICLSIVCLDLLIVRISLKSILFMIMFKLCYLKIIFIKAFHSYLMFKDENEHIFCNKCIKNWLELGQKNCPIGNESILLQTMKTSRLVKNILAT